jgi:N-acetylmuramoyl-L-alanine amidase
VPAPSASGGQDLAVGEHLLDPATALPPRAEVVALSDRLGIAATRANGDEAGRLAWIAARLRERLWRIDRVDADAHEALALYAAVTRAAPASERACRAQERRAVLTGETTRNAERAFAETYLALRQHRASAANTEDAERCAARLEATLSVVDAYRPTGDAWRQLEREATRQIALAAQLPGDGARARQGREAAAASAVPSASVPSGDIVLVPDAAMVGKGSADLTAIEPYSWERGGRVVLSLSAPAHYEVGVLPPDPGAGRGHRVYVDLRAVRIRGAKRDLAVGGLVERVRVGTHQAATRVVLDLVAFAHRRVFYLPDPFRVVVDLSTRAVQAAEAPPPDKGGARGVRRVAIDPGHGGWDTGAIGPTGLREKDVTLDVAHRAAPLLAHELGVETLLTRDTDAYVPLEERTARANAYHADLFVSIHCNATDDGHAQGVEIFVLDPSRTMDAVTLRAVLRENRYLGATRTEAPRARAERGLAELGAQVSTIAAGLGGESERARARTLAELLRRSTLASLGARYPASPDHGVKTAGFFVLLGAEMPAVLYETAFISNPEDEKRLGTADFRQKLADALVNAIRAYREGAE